MNRTREIEVYVSRSELENLDNKMSKGITVLTTDYLGNFKAKLIIELPERKVTISESEFDEIYYKAIRTLISGHEYGPHLKEALFKDAE